MDKMYVMRKEFTIERDKITGKIKVLAPEENTTAYRNNKIVEMTKAVLTHETTADKMLNPGGFDQQKKMGYMVQAFKQGKYTWEQLEQMDIDTIKDICYQASDLTFVDTQVQFYKQNSAAGSILAIFAVAKVAHATLESNKFRVALDGDVSKGGVGLQRPITIAGFQIGSNTDMSVEIDPKYDSRGNLIGKTLGSLVASAADAVKDPVLNLMNINSNTVNILNTLIRMGMPFESAAMLLSTNAITNILQEFNKRNLTENVSLATVINEKIAEIEKKYGELKETEFEELSIDELQEGIQDQAQSIEDPNVAKRTWKILKTIYTVGKINDALRGVNFVTRFNSISNAVGPLVIDNLIKDYKMRDEAFSQMRDSEGNPISIKDIFDKHPILQQFSRTVPMARELLSSMPAYSNVFKEALNTMYGLDSIFYGDRALLGKFNDFLQSYALIASHTIDSKELNYYLNKFTVDFSNKRNEDKIKDNPLIQAIRIVKDKQGTLYLKVDVSGLDPQQKGDLSAAWVDLLKVDKELAIDLFKYNFFRGGIGFTPKTFMSLLPMEVKQAIPNYVETYRHLPVMDAKLLMDQFVQNNWENNKLVPLKKLTTKDGNPLYKQQGKFISVSSDIVNSPYFKVKNADGKYILYKRVTDIKDAKYLTYAPLDILGGNHQYLEMYETTNYSPVTKEVTKIEDEDTSQLQNIDAEVADFGNEQTMSYSQIIAEEVTRAAQLITDLYGPLDSNNQSRVMLENTLKEYNIQVTKEELDRIISEQNLCQ